MREIKFKGKDKDGRWWHGSYLYLPDSDSHHIMPCGTYKPSTETLVVEYVEVDPATVGQYTGLKDKNGTEIYDGDILRSDRYPFSCLEDGEKDNYYAVVQWCDEEACFAAFYEVSAHAKVRGISAGMNLMDFSEVCAMEVIGNIHDNPELLKGGEI